MHKLDSHAVLSRTCRKQAHPCPIFPSPTPHCVSPPVILTMSEYNWNTLDYLSLIYRIPYPLVRGVCEGIAQLSDS